MFCLGLLWLWGCEEAQDFEVELSSSKLLVVESIITNENKQHQVKLSETFDDFNSPAPPVEDAFVALLELNGTDTTVFVLTPDPDRPGVYLTDSLRAIFGRFYILFINTESKEYFAFATAALGAPLEPLLLEEQDDGLMEYIYEESAEPSMMEIFINWEEPEADAPIAKEIHAFFYTLDVIDVNKIFAPDKEKVIFPKGAMLFRRKYGLTKDHQNFLRSLLSEIDWRGGPFDVAQGNVKTNMSEGAIGYFAVSMVQTDETIVE